jgi:hypothetical protein
MRGRPCRKHVCHARIGPGLGFRVWGLGFRGSDQVLVVVGFPDDETFLVQRISSCITRVTNLAHELRSLDTLALGQYNCRPSALRFEGEDLSSTQVTFLHSWFTVTVCWGVGVDVRVLA